MGALRSTRILAGVALALAAMTGQAQTLDAQLAEAFSAAPARFVGYESVPYSPPDRAPEKYLILDFRFAQMPAEQRLQASVHQLCRAVLLDRSLVRTLSDAGYDRLAVAFDQRFQYDCF